MSCHLYPARSAYPMPRPNVHNQNGGRVPLAAQGHGRNVTPGQGFNRKFVHVSGQSLHTHVPAPVPVYHPVHAYDQPTHVVHHREAFVPMPPARRYHHVSGQNNTYYSNNHYTPRSTSGTLSFFGLLAKCVAISIVALFLLAIMI